MVCIGEGLSKIPSKSTLLQPLLHHEEREIFCDQVNALHIYGIDFHSKNILRSLGNMQFFMEIFLSNLVKQAAEFSLGSLTQ